MNTDELKLIPGSDKSWLAVLAHYRKECDWMAKRIRKNGGAIKPVGISGKTSGISNYASRADPDRLLLHCDDVRARGPP